METGRPNVGRGTTVRGTTVRRGTTELVTTGSGLAVSDCHSCFASPALHITALQPRKSNDAMDCDRAQFRKVQHFSNLLQNIMKASTVSIIKATAPLVSQHARQITGLFYKNMFANNPETLQFFNQANQVRRAFTLHLHQCACCCCTCALISSVERGPSAASVGQCHHRLWFQH